MNLLLRQPLYEKLAVEEKEGIGFAGERLVARAGHFRTGDSLDLVEKSIKGIPCHRVLRFLQGPLRFQKLG